MEERTSISELAMLNQDDTLTCQVCLMILNDSQMFNKHLRSKIHIQAIDNHGNEVQKDTNLAYKLQNGVQNQINNTEIIQNLKRKAKVNVENIEPLFNYQVDKKQKTYRIIEEYVTFISDDESQNENKQIEQPKIQMETEEIQIENTKDSKMIYKAIIEDDKEQQSKLENTIMLLKNKQKELKQQQKNKCDIEVQIQNVTVKSDTLMDENDIFQTNWQRKKR